LAPEQIVVAVDLEFDDGLSANDIEQTGARLECRMREAHPSVIAVFVKPKAVVRGNDTSRTQRTAL
jgi:divalent metal cation (Fe/Co/Zn/Cd) transporter